MGNPLTKSEPKFTNIKSDPTNARTVEEKGLRKSQENAPRTQRSVDIQKPTPKVYDIDKLMSKRHLAVDDFDQKFNKKQKNNSNIMSKDNVLTDMQQICSSLSSIDRRIENIELSVTQTNEMMELLETAQSFIKQICRSLESQHISSTSNSAGSTYHINTNNPRSSRNKSEYGSAISEAEINPGISAQNEYVAEVENEMRVGGFEPSEVETKVTGVPSTSGTKSGNESLAVAKTSDFHQEKAFLQICKIKSYLLRLTIDKGENETVIRELKEAKRLLIKYSSNSSQRIMEITQLVLPNVENMLSKGLNIQRQKEMILNGKYKDIQKNIEYLKNLVKFCNPSDSDSCKMISIYLSLFDKYLVANELLHQRDKENVMELVEQIFECFRKKVSTTEKANAKHEMNLTKLGNGNHQIDTQTLIVTEKPLEVQMKPSNSDEIDENSVCRAIEKLELKSQESNSIPLVQNNPGENESMNEIKLHQIEKRRDEIKSEIETFVGTRSNPKFYELNEYSTRLLLEMDDLTFPKGSDLHSRKRELLKEVYQYSDILEKKARDSGIVEDVENYINYIHVKFDELKHSAKDLKTIAENLKIAKYNLEIIDPKNNLEEKKRICTSQIFALENAVSESRNRMNTYSSVTRRTIENSHVQEPEGQNSPGDISSELNDNSNKATGSSNGIEEPPVDQSIQSDSIGKKVQVMSNNIDERITDNPVQKPISGMQQIDNRNYSRDRNNIPIDSTSDLQTVEEQTIDNGSHVDRVTYETRSSQTNNNYSNTVLDEMEAKIIDAMKNVESLFEYDSIQECQLLKNNLILQYNELKELKIDTEGSCKRRRGMKRRIWELVEGLAQQIKALEKISDVEVELKGYGKSFENLTEEKIMKLRKRLIHLQSKLGIITFNGNFCLGRLKQCDGIIQYHLEEIDRKMKPCYSSTEV